MSNVDASYNKTKTAIDNTYNKSKSFASNVENLATKYNLKDINLKGGAAQEDKNSKSCTTMYYILGIVVIIFIVLVILLLLKKSGSSGNTNSRYYLTNYDNLEGTDFIRVGTPASVARIVKANQESGTMTVAILEKSADQNGNNNILPEENALAQYTFKVLKNNENILVGKSATGSDNIVHDIVITNNKDARKLMMVIYEKETSTDGIAKPISQQVYMHNY